MMRSLYAGVSGMQNHQVRMDVIGNNIANVNTTGFKKGRVNFQDMLSQTMSGAARPTDTVGGVNPKQIGLGMVIASIDTIHTQGSMQSTGNNMDMGISGNGFFILKDGDKTFYTRAGAFGLDKNGLMVNPGTGLKVQGWTSKEIGGEYIIRSAENPDDITIPLYSKDPAKATKNIDFKCNLFSEMPIISAADYDAGNVSEKDMLTKTWTASIDMFDSEGTPLEARYTFHKTDTNSWRAVVDVYRNDPDNPGQKIKFADTDYSLSTNSTNITAGQKSFNLTFDNMGRLIKVNDAAGNLVENGMLGVNLNVRVPNQTVIDPNNNPRNLPSHEMSVKMNLGEYGRVRNNENIGITQFSSEFTTKPFRQDGYQMGYLEGLKIDDKGEITGVFTNGNNRVMAQVALANFSNVSGLEKAGETNFVYSNNSGEPDISPAGSMGKGKIMAGALEMSNVDLSEQFVDMIVTQRGFQANSKTIQTSDQMLQELLQLKR